MPHSLLHVSSLLLSADLRSVVVVKRHCIASCMASTGYCRSSSAIHVTYCCLGVPLTDGSLKAVAQPSPRKSWLCPSATRPSNPFDPHHHSSILLALHLHQPFLQDHSLLHHPSWVKLTSTLSTRPRRARRVSHSTHEQETLSLTIFRS